MTSSNSWYCDGVPKNGQKYPNLGGYHNSHLNHSSNCEICGLPKETQHLPSKKQDIGKLSSLFSLFARLALAGVVALASGVAVYTFLDRGCEVGLEKIDGECKDSFLQTYEDATQKGNEAIALADNYQTLEDLETAQSNLTNVITDLNQIPLEASIYSKVESQLEEYQAKKLKLTPISSEKDRLKSS